MTEQHFHTWRKVSEGGQSVPYWDCACGVYHYAEEMADILQVESDARAEIIRRFIAKYGSNVLEEAAEVSDGE